MATQTATWAYRDEFQSFARTYFRRFADCVVSSIGLGTYLGDSTDEVDEEYHDAIVRAVEHGVNVIDTAINYRHQRSERTVGRAIRDTDTDRESILVATKGGFVPFDTGRPDDPGAYIQTEYIDPGVIEPADLVQGIHSIAPAFIEDQLDRSLVNLDLDVIDLYYVHNPETQLKARSQEEVYDLLEATLDRKSTR